MDATDCAIDGTVNDASREDGLPARWVVAGAMGDAARTGGAAGTSGLACGLTCTTACVLGAGAVLVFVLGTSTEVFSTGWGSDFFGGRPTGFGGVFPAGPDATFAIALAGCGLAGARAAGLGVGFSIGLGAGLVGDLEPAALTGLVLAATLCGFSWTLPVGLDACLAFGGLTFTS